eukprot:TRINITY_DN8313_c0_g1_i5.p2 TRINITY_DN8313_c0_g1~~TRINITY_DN8313_c0_g1_i5.p2  ORF type:complete len:341 (+),score=73.45 TRINITY_DN8313_c0_g1_i5:1877-2899(+)
MIQRQVQQNRESCVYHLEQTSPHDVVGILWGISSDRYIVTDVEENSAACRVGIVQGMHLVAIEDDVIDSSDQIEYLDSVFQEIGHIRLTLLPPDIMAGYEGETQECLRESSAEVPAVVREPSVTVETPPQSPLIQRAPSCEDGSQTSEAPSGTPMSPGLRRRQTQPSQRLSFSARLPDIKVNDLNRKVSLKHLTTQLRSPTSADVACRLSRLEAKSDTMSTTLNRIDNNVRSLLNALDLVLDKDRSEQDPETRSPRLGFKLPDTEKILSMSSEPSENPPCRRVSLIDIRQSSSSDFLSPSPEHAPPLLPPRSPPSSPPSPSLTRQVEVIRAMQEEASDQS